MRSQRTQEAPNAVRIGQRERSKLQPVSDQAKRKRVGDRHRKHGAVRGVRESPCKRHKEELVRGRAWGKSGSWRHRKHKAAYHRSRLRSLLRLRWQGGTRRETRPTPVERKRVEETRMWRRE